MADVILLHSPTQKLEKVQMHCFDRDAREFLSKLFNEFDEKIEVLYKSRLKANLATHSKTTLEFKRSPERANKNWTIAPLPSRLQNRHLDLGDVSASNTAHFISALNSDVQGIQVDFDDGHCPTWRNQLMAFNNIYCAVHDTTKLPGAPLSITTCPILMFRPRAWNIIEHHILINGKEAPGALIDFGIIMYHNAARLYQTNSGPYFYLSKLESAEEARLWDEIFVWTQRELGIPRGTIKACVLIENIFSVFELDEILYSLREHSLGLNCGMWDYCASIIAKLGDRKQFILPDRNKYVSMDQHFLSSYIRVVVATAHARGAPATGGMAALMLHQGSNLQDERSKKIITKILEAKAKEIDWGVDGFMVYDTLVVPFMNELWKKSSSTQNQIHLKFDMTVTAQELLAIPGGGVTLRGLEHNVAVSVLFVYYWLDGRGHYFYHGAVEDSATAEISRWQVWQWLRFGFDLTVTAQDLLAILHNGALEASPTAEISRWHYHQWPRFGVSLEDNSEPITSALVESTVAKFMADAHKRLCRSPAERKRLTAAGYMSLELFFARSPPEFLTTYLNDNHKFRALNNKALAKASI